MRYRLHRFMFYIWCAVLLQQCVAAAAPCDIDLPNSSIELPWSVFNKLSNRTPDTVFIEPEGQPPTAITFGEARCSAVLHDSMAEMTLTVGYSVFANKGWVEEQLFDPEFSGALESVTLPKGDFLRSTDEEGYLLVADALNKNRSRRLTVTFIVPAGADEGDVTVETGLPKAVRCLLDITAPASFTEIAVQQAFPLGTQRKNSLLHYRFLMNAAGGSAEISYKVPVKEIPGDTLTLSEVPPDTVAAEPVVTVRQESAVFPAKENAFVYNALRFDVARVPITRFSVELPDSFSLLALSGNGIRTWKKPEHGNVLEVNLGFALEGHYSLYIAGEQPADSQVVIPSIRVREAAHQSGTFALAVAKGSEALLLSAENCVDFSRSEFLRGLSPGYADSIARYGHSLQNIALAGQYFKVPFSARFLIRRHMPVPVADALCDAGSIRTVISIDAKVLTQASFLIRHRGRQFIALTLPDSINLWSVTLDGMRASPSTDDSGRYKISLQRNYTAAENGISSMLEITYLATMKTALPGRTFHLQAPVTDIPVGKLEWAVFYPERWAVKNTDGTFTAAQTTLLGRRYYALDRSEQQSLYRTLQESNTAQQSTAKAGSALSLLPESPRHLFAHTILVVNEQPWIKIRFGSRAVRRTITLLLVLGGIAALAAGVIIGWRRVRRG